MTKIIPLTQGKVALVDDDDFDELNKYKWCANESIGKIWYALRNTERINGKQKHIFMHRLITNCPTEMNVDHVNHDGLDNRRCNLRVCNHLKNMQNRRMHKNNTSGLKGVSFEKSRNKWRAQISINNKDIVIGLFCSKEEAGRAYDEKSKELFGDFSNPNFF